MGGRGGSSGAGGGGGKSPNNARESRIQELRQRNAALMQSDYSGRKNWDRQLDARVKEVARNNREIEKLESQAKKSEAKTKSASSKNTQARTNTKSTMKWSTTQKEEYSGGSLKPRIIKSGSYEIRGKSVLKVFHSGEQIGTASTLSAAKEIAERHKKKRF